VPGEPVLVDCDPGHDDVLAILTAHRHATLVGITTVAGNAALEHTTRNALVTCELAGIDVPVHSGAAGPLSGPTRDAVHVHGSAGLDGVEIPVPRRAPDGTDAPGWIVETARATPGLWIAAVGPLTNIALALQRDPGLGRAVAGISIMGGGTFGNATPAAEFNIWADPEAAAIVFSAGWTVRMIGLDVTLLARATAAVQQRMGSLGRLGSRLLLPALAQYRDSADATGEPPVHDVCAIVSIADPSVFSYTPALVQVETHGALTSGMTVTDFAAPAGYNAQVATGIDAGHFWETVLGAYQRLPVARD
jgi:purine nucleosidase